MEAVVVTWDKHFDELVKLAPKGTRRRFRRLGRISFKCKAPRSRELAEKWIDLIEIHHQSLQSKGNQRLIVEIRATFCKFIG